MSFEEEESTAIDWEAPFDDIRSSEVNEITLEFQDNGQKILKTDEHGEPYTQYVFNCIRKDISNPREVRYLTSSKRLIEEMQSHAPIEGKILEIVKTGSGFQTKYKIEEV